MKQLSDIDWPTWKPQDVATLLFIITGGQVLLIRKKRGLGAGKINAPGGRLEPGETPLQAAVREVQEEVGLTPSGVHARGELAFQFVDGYALYCHVFTADAYTGTLTETDEAMPLWTALDALPFPEMWADDSIWLPHLLKGERFFGRFLFSGDTMLDHEFSVLEG